MKKILISCVFFTTSCAANAAGYALAEQSGSGLGNAFANGAAGEDASAMYANPASMTYVKGMQAVNAIHFIKLNAEFQDQGSVNAAPRPLGNEGGNIGELAFVPNAYFKMDLNDNIKLGIGLSVPFGLKTAYDANWIGRFQGVESELKTININPAVAFKVNDQLSLGLGVSAMWAKAKLTSVVNLGAAESTSEVEGDDWGFGFNLGAIYQATADTRFGAAYRAKVDQHLEGEATSPFTGLNANPNGTLNANVTADVTLPESLAVNVFSKVNNTWDVMADITWARWSQFKELRILRANGSTLTVTPENWENVMRYSVGANYHYSDSVMFRTGLAYDEEPIKDQFRTVRIPGNDRKWLTFGASWQTTPTTKLDASYAHVFISDTPIDDDQRGATPSKGRVKGVYESDVNILSLQISHNF